MEKEQHRGTLRVVYKRGAEEEEAELNTTYIKKLEEVKRMKKNMRKVNEILHNKGKYFKVF